MNGLERIAENLRSNRFAVTRLPDGSGVLLEVEGLQVLSLNATGMFLLDTVANGATEAEELVRELVRVFDVDETTARNDLDAFLAEFLRRLG